MYVYIYIYCSSFYLFIYTSILLLRSLSLCIYIYIYIHIAQRGVSGVCVPAPSSVPRFPAHCLHVAVVQLSLLYSYAKLIKISVMFISCMIINHPGPPVHRSG